MIPLSDVDSCHDLVHINLLAICRFNKRPAFESYPCILYSLRTFEGMCQDMTSRELQAARGGCSSLTINIRAAQRYDHPLAAIALNTHSSPNRNLPARNDGDADALDKHAAEAAPSQPLVARTPQRPSHEFRLTRRS